MSKRKTKCSNCKADLLRTKARAKGRCYCSNHCMLEHQYRIGVRDGSKATENAHQILRTRGHYMRDNTYLVERNPATSLEARKKISKRKLEVNWMRGRTKELSPNYCGGKTSYRGFDWNNIKRRVKERDEFKCVSCGLTEKENLKLTGQVLQVDHIIPYRVTEDNSMKNLQTLCNKCHGEKLKIDLPIMKASLSYK